MPKITEEPIKVPVIEDVLGPDAETMFMAYRCNGEHSSDKIYIDLISKILYNGMAGLIDIDLIQEQEILDGYCYSNFNTQYGVLFFSMNPKEDQTLEDLKDLVLKEIEKVKQGDFPDWMLEAIANQNRLGLLRRFQDNFRAFDFLDAFIMEKEWRNELTYPDELEKISKVDIVDFANKFFKDNYVIVNKREGKAEGLVKVEKPEITAININRDDESTFYTD